MVMAGYLKGAREAGRNLTFTINERTGRFPWSGELHYHTKLIVAGKVSGLVDQQTYHQIIICQY